MPSSYSGKGADELVKQFESNIKNKVILISGVSPNGLGAFFSEAVAKGSPKLLILAGRDSSKIQATQESIKKIAPEVETRALILDLNSFKSVREAAEEVNNYAENINVLVNNAGIMGVPFKKTEDGFESQFQSNHLGPFLFTNLIIKKILASGPESRVVNVSSNAYRLGGVRYFDYNFHDGESYNPWTAYGAGKTGNILHAQELAKRLGNKGLVTASLHPGIIWTNLPTHGAMEEFGNMATLDKQLGNPFGWAEIVGVEPNIGVANHVYCAFSPDVKNHNGRYVEDFDNIPTPLEIMNPWAVGDLEAKKTWELSEQLVGEKFDF